MVHSLKLLSKPSLNKILNMSIKNKLMLTAAVGLALGASSCRKFMNVNTNPNISQTATMATLLPAGQLWVGSALGVDLQVNGSIWSQYWTQTSTASQYIAFEQYAPGQDAFSTPWTDLYRGAENFYQLQKLADSLHSKQYKAISLIMQAYTFQLLTDAWGDVPFTQALKGDVTDGHMVNPKFDSQIVVYRGVLAYIDSAKKLLNNGDAVKPGSDDLIYNGDMNKWRRFANTLKLRALLRMSAVNPTGVQAMVDSFYATSPDFLTGTIAGDDAQIKYGWNTQNKSPLYAEASSTTLASVQNLAGSSTCIDSMNANGDPRAYVFYKYLSNGAVAGLTQGSYYQSSAAGTFSLPSKYVAGDAQDDSSGYAPVNFLTVSESYFLQAEVVARGWQAASSGYADDSLYYKGIGANFAMYNNQLAFIWGPKADTDYINGGGYWSVYPSTGSFAQKQRFIVTQKWFSMCGNQGFEAWTEWRRTGYPDFLIHPVKSMIGSDRPRRFLYPTSESSTNANFPGVAPLTSKVWWDVL